MPTGADGKVAVQTRFESAVADVAQFAPPATRMAVTGGMSEFATPSTVVSAIEIDAVPVEMYLGLRMALDGELVLGIVIVNETPVLLEGAVIVPGGVATGTGVAPGPPACGVAVGIGEGTGLGEDTTMGVGDALGLGVAEAAIGFSDGTLADEEPPPEHPVAVNDKTARAA